jgi:hypothetical protein
MNYVRSLGAAKQEAGEPAVCDPVLEPKRSCCEMRRENGHGCAIF